MAQIDITRDDVYITMGELYAEKEALRKFGEALELVVGKLKDEDRFKEGKIANLTEENEELKKKLAMKARRRAATTAK